MKVWCTAGHGTSKIIECKTTEEMEPEYRPTTIQVIQILALTHQ